MLTLILLLQISSTLPAPAIEPVIEFEVEVLEPLKWYVEQQLEEGGVRVAKGSELISLQGSKGERVLGIPRLIQQQEGSVLTLKLVQTWLPAASKVLTVEKFNEKAFSLKLTYVLWESSCDPANDEHHTCFFTEVLRDFLRRYGTLPVAWPTDDEWAKVNRRAW